jgi:hypothetical protein
VLCNTVETREWEQADFTRQASNLANATSVGAGQVPDGTSSAGWHNSLVTCLGGSTRRQQQAARETSDKSAGQALRTAEYGAPMVIGARAAARVIASAGWQARTARVPAAATRLRTP